MTAALEGGEWSAAHPGRNLPPEKTRYPFYRRLGGPQGRSGRVKNLIPTGIRSRTVQPVAQSLYRLSYPVHLSPYKQQQFITFPPQCTHLCSFRFHTGNCEFSRYTIPTDTVIRWKYFLNNSGTFWVRLDRKTATNPKNRRLFVW